MSLFALPVLTLLVACSGGEEEPAEAVDCSTWTNLVRATDGETCLRAYDDCASLCF